jgi:hypothetical protein
MTGGHKCKLNNLIVTAALTETKPATMVSNGPMSDQQLSNVISNAQNFANNLAHVQSPSSAATVLQNG